jgi:hypothetical protein
MQLFSNFIQIRCKKSMDITSRNKKRLRDNHRNMGKEHEFPLEKRGKTSQLRER